MCEALAAGHGVRSPTAVFTPQHRRAVARTRPCARVAVTMQHAASVAAQHVGIRGMYLYFPRMVVSQADLEAADGVPGKYTAGLGQAAMGFTGDREDVVSMAATAVLRLLEGAAVPLTEVGRLDVGTETGVDRSKSVMSYLLEHFAAAGNTNIMGSDHMHGCYGATAALLSVADWVAAPGWDGRLGVVVATDIAVYPPGSPARPTGGCGAAALLVGPDAPLVLERAPWRSHFAAHTFDFFKPHGHPLYPVVDGPQTLLWFTRAADACAARLHDQLHAAGQLPTASAAGAGSGAAPTQQQQQDEGQQQQQQQQPSDQQAAAVGGLLSCVDFFISHAPYNKLVRKVFARLVMQDCLRARARGQREQQQHLDSCPQPQHLRDGSSGGAQGAIRQLPPLPPEAAGLEPPAACSGSSSSSSGRGGGAARLVFGVGSGLPDSSITDKALERALLAASAGLYEDMAAPAAALQRQLGNLYTASLYSGLAGLLSDAQRGGAALAGKRVLCFSFGSGVVASMFVLRGREAGCVGGAGEHAAQAGGSSSDQQHCGCSQGQQQQDGFVWRQQPCSLEAMAQQLRLLERLDSRLRCSVADFDAAMASLRCAYNAAPHTPSYGSVEALEPGTVFLQGIDASFRRRYGRTPPADAGTADSQEA